MKRVHVHGKDYVVALQTTKQRVLVSEFIDRDAQCGVNRPTEAVEVYEQAGGEPAWVGLSVIILSRRQFDAVAKVLGYQRVRPFIEGGQS